MNTQQRWYRTNKQAAIVGQSMIDNAMPPDDEDQADDDFVEPDFDDNQISNYYDGT